MIPKKQKVVRDIATLVIVIGIIALAIISAQAKNGKVQSTTAGSLNTTTQTQIPDNKIEVTVDETGGKDVQASAVAIAPAKKPDKKPVKDFYYTVKSGDTLYDLALTYGVSVDDIKNVNNLAVDNLQLDQKLLIPVSGQFKPKKPTRIAAQAKPRKVYHVASRSGGRTVGELVAWDTARNLFAIGDTAAVIDVNTGLSFRIKRKGGSNHADNEPLTAEDTAIMKQIYGGSWSWDRRAVVLVVDGKKIAASMAGMPHGSENITNNDFSGHFDIHFKGSMTHGSEYTKSRRPVVDSQHQAMVRKAAGL